MENNDREIRFQSTLAPLMEQFIEEKHACGYRYHSSARLLASFDRFLAGETLPPGELPRPIIRKWLAKKPHESALTHQRRISIVRQFALFMCRLGYRAYVPDRSLAAKNHAEFSPRILTQDEVEKILQAVDHLPLTARSPLRHLIMPEVFRLLYGCGFRLNEVLQLRVRDVDLNHGILTVRHGKFGKDRLVPPALPLVLRLQKYAAAFGVRPPRGDFLPFAPRGTLEYQDDISLIPAAAAPMRHLARRTGQGTAGARPASYLCRTYPSALVPRGRRPQRQATGVGDLLGPSIDGRNATLLAPDRRFVP